MADYAQEYSDENIKRLRDLYAQSQQSTYDKAAAQLRTSLGAGGTLFGTPYQQKGGALATQLAGNVAGYEGGLRSTGLQQSANERLIAEQRAYEDPYRKAELTGQYGGSPTFAYQQWSTMSPYQQAMVNATNTQQQLDNVTALYNMLASSGVLGRAADWWDTILGGSTSGAGSTGLGTLLA